MYDSELKDKDKKKKRKKPQNSIGKSGGELSLSAKGDENARKYLGDMDTPLPEKFSYKRQEDPQGMETVKPSVFSQKSSGERAGTFSFDTGWMEMGYDEKKKQTIISVKSNYRDEKARKVSENNAKTIPVEDGKRVMSNDKDFQEGAVALRYSRSKGYREIRKQWDMASKKKDNNTTYDDVLPFHQIEQQRERIKQLQDMQKSSSADRSGIGKAITGIQTYLNKKQSKNLEFNQKFERAVEETKARFSGMTGDDFLLFIKKQLLEEKKVPDVPQDDKDKEKEENEEIADEKELDQEEQASKA